MTYSTKLLINTNLIPVGSEILIKNDSDNIEVTPSRILIKDDDSEGGLVVKSISAKGYEIGSIATVTASFNGFSAKLFIEIIDKEVHYPKYRFEFWPVSVVSRPKSKCIAKLYINVNKFPLNSNVHIVSDNDILSIEQQIFTIDSGNFLTEEIAKLDVLYDTLVTEGDATITANIGDLKAKLIVTVSDTQEAERDQGNSGIIAGVKIRGDQQFWQTFYNTKDGCININSENNVNKLHFPYINPDNFEPDKSQRQYLADLCANEAAKLLVKKKIEIGKIQYGEYEAVLDEIQKEKNKLVDGFIKSLDSFII